MPATFQRRRILSFDEFLVMQDKRVVVTIIFKAKLVTNHTFDRC
jgi:hypothetical protein